MPFGKNLLIKRQKLTNLCKKSLHEVVEPKPKISYLLETIMMLLV